MYFGTRIPHYVLMREVAGGRHENIIKLIQMIEEAGFDHLGDGDHMMDMGVSHHGQDAAQFVHGDPLTSLAFYAGLTKRLRLVTEVLIIPYRQPIGVASALATLDRLSAGRVVLGAGVGYVRSEFEALGIPLDERGTRTDEYLDIITALWTEESVTFRGKYFSFENTSIIVNPLQKPRPQIWIGGSGKRALDRAILRGDGWMPIITGYPRAGKKPIRVNVTPHELKEGLAYANERRTELGKPPLHAVLACGSFLRFSNSPTPRSDTADIWHQTIAETGTPEQLTEHLMAYREAGGHGVTVGLRASTIDECFRTIETFATRVMPAFARG